MVLIASMLSPRGADLMQMALNAVEEASGQTALMDQMLAQAEKETQDARHLLACSVFTLALARFSLVVLLA